MSAWYSRPIVAVADIERALAFYVGALGFAEDWRYGEDGAAFIVQVSRPGCELILSSQWPERVGSNLLFVSLEPDVLSALEAGLAQKGVATQSGWWGYRLLIV